jgi:hypothetical protein
MAKSHIQQGKSNVTAKQIRDAIKLLEKQSKIDNFQCFIGTPFGIVEMFEVGIKGRKKAIKWLYNYMEKAN